MPSTHLDEGLIGTLHDSLCAYIDPGSGRHLAVHHKALSIEIVEVIPRGPVRHKVGVGDEHPRSVRMGAKDADGLAGLHQQGLVVLQIPECSDDAVETLPIAGGPADAAVDDEFSRL